MNFPKLNNLDWLRLLFAGQVVALHASTFLYESKPLLIGYFPGVPAFFFLSGFLVYASYMNSDRIGTYLKNRFLRVYPALLLVTFFGLAVILYAKGFEHLTENPVVYVTWFFSQITLGQGYNPSEFSDVGMGQVNGALWTVTVEVLFYFSVPIIVALERAFKHAVLLLFGMSFALYVLSDHYLDIDFIGGDTLHQYVQFTPAFWGWMFLTGVLAVKYYDQFAHLIKHFKFAVIGMALIILMRVDNPIFASDNNQLGILYYLAYAMIIMYLAFGTRHIPLKFDLSYGAYIFHIPVINFLLIADFHNGMALAAIVGILTIASWTFVEKPSLSLKKRSIRPIQMASSIG